MISCAKDHNNITSFNARFFISHTAKWYFMTVLHTLVDVNFQNFLFYKNLDVKIWKVINVLLTLVNLFADTIFAFILLAPGLAFTSTVTTRRLNLLNHWTHSLNSN